MREEDKPIPFRCPRCGKGKYGRHSHMCKDLRELDKKFKGEKKEE